MNINTSLLNRLEFIEFKQHILFLKQPNHKVKVFSDLSLDEYLNIKDYVNTLQFVDADIIGKNHVLLDFKNNKELYEKCDEYKDSYCNSLFIYSLFINSNKFIDFINNLNLIKSDIFYSFNKFTMYSDDEFNISKSNEIFNLINV